MKDFTPVLVHMFRLSLSPTHNHQPVASWSSVHVWEGTKPSHSSSEETAADSLIRRGEETSLFFLSLFKIFTSLFSSFCLKLSLINSLKVWGSNSNKSCRQFAEFTRLFCPLSFSWFGSVQALILWETDVVFLVKVLQMNVSVQNFKRKGEKGHLILTIEDCRGSFDFIKIVVLFIHFGLHWSRTGQFSPHSLLAVHTVQYGVPHPADFSLSSKWTKALW